VTPSAAVDLQPKLVVMICAETRATRVRKIQVFMRGESNYIQLVVPRFERFVSNKIKSQSFLLPNAWKVVEAHSRVGFEMLGEVRLV
jgi:hypothetical protein